MVNRVVKKTTLVKDVVGKVRTSTRDLPPSFHTYGAFINKDIEGAGAVISSWKETKKSAMKTSERNLIKTNVLAIDHGNITAKDMRLFAQAHPEIRFPIPSYEGRKKDKIPFDGPYGLESEKMPWPLSALIEARFTDFSREGKDYPDVSAIIMKKLRIPPSRATKASQGHNVTLKPPPKEESTFVMKRFRDVPGRVRAPNPGVTRRPATASM